MGLCNAETRKRRPFKTIIIPRGIINPNENNIIEIPLNLDANSSLIVKAPNDENSSFSVEPYGGHMKDIPSYRLEAGGPLMSSARSQEPYYPFPDTMSSIRADNTYVPVVSPNVDVRPRSRADFSCQTQGWCSSGQQTIFQPPCVQSAGVQSNIPLDAHSPLCPICARASCKFYSTSGMNRSYSCRYPTPPPPSPSPPCPGQIDPCTIYNRPYSPTCYPVREPASFRLSSLPCSKSEIFSGIKKPNEQELLNKMLDDKIDKILKPLLLSLARISPDDESELNCSPCTQKYSTTYVEPKYSRERFCPRRSDPMETNFSDFGARAATSFEPSFSQRHSSADSDYEEFRREANRRRDMYSFNLESTRKNKSYPKYPSGFLSGNIVMNNADSFDESRRRKTVDRDLDGGFPMTPKNSFNCPPSASCQRRANVSFGEYDKEMEVNEKEKSQDLDSSFITLDKSAAPSKSSSN
jgi:hypothetical protein